MIEKQPESFSDIVDRAVGELRSSPVPPGPPPELLNVLLQAARENDGAVQGVRLGPLSLWERVRVRPPAPLPKGEGSFRRSAGDHSSHISFPFPNHMEVDHAFPCFSRYGCGHFRSCHYRSRLVVPRRRRDAGLRRLPQADPGSQDGQI